MRERTVGRSGLVVGDIGLGTLTWGRDTDADEAHKQLRILLDHGGNLIDTSPEFGHGAAESLVGSLLNGPYSRSDVVLCTRAGFTAREGRARFGAGRGALFDSVESSLQRLGTSYIDILVVAAPDPIASDAETARALGDLVAQGKVRYLGVQGYEAWRASALTQRLEDAGLPTLNLVETELSLLCRGSEAELLPMASHFNMGVFATSPLGRGVLTGKYRRSIPPTSRAATKHLGAFVEPYLDERPRRIVEAVARAADGLAVGPADVALAWVLTRPRVAAALVGARTSAQLAALLSSEMTLPRPVVEALDDVTG